jgi:phospholipid/cholesterol/gamma-HCH transport system substrate-binding protein
MEKNTTQKLKLGIFITIGILLLTAGVFFIGDAKKMFTNTFKISANFKDINGLQVGNNVRFAGINVGTIEGLKCWLIPL